MDYHVKTEDLGKIYKRWYECAGNCALCSLTIEVPAGSVFGFLGRNGAGKTTAIRLMLGLTRPTTGRVWLLGKEVDDMAVKKDIGYMPEMPALDMRDTPRTLLTMVGRLSGMPQALIAKRIEEVTAEVGIQNSIDAQFGTFSKGMKQRGELAQALFANPKLLILDEPFSGLDPLGRREIRDLIIRYNKSKNTTVFFSSHILSDVEFMCDSFGIIDKGVLKTVGQKDELLGIDYIEVSGVGIQQAGQMFLEKMSDHISREKDKLSVFVAPNKDSDKVAEIFRKHGATDVRIQKRCKSLEDFFIATVGSEAEHETGR